MVLFKYSFCTAQWLVGINKFIQRGCREMESVKLAKIDWGGRANSRKDIY